MYLCSMFYRPLTARVKTSPLPRILAIPSNPILIGSFHKLNVCIPQPKFVC